MLPYLHCKTILVSRGCLRSLYSQNWRQSYCLYEADAYTCKDEFFNKICHIRATFASHCTLERALELDKVKLCSAHSHFRLTFSSIFWASRHTSCSTAFGYSIIKGTMSQLVSTFHIPWHFFARLLVHRS